MTSEVKQYNYSLDFIKGIACIFVVLMHCEFPGKLGIVVQTISRFCVPFFFMVSGYYAANLADSKNRSGFYLLNHKVLHISKITFYASVFYFVFAIFQYLVWHDVSLEVNRSEILIFLLFNEPIIIAGQLWFLFALLYDYVLITILDKWNLQKYELKAGIIMLVLFYLVGQGVHIAGGGIPVPDFIIHDFKGSIPYMEGGRVPVPNFIYRNFLFEGFAFFMLGRIIRKYRCSLKINNAVLYTIMIISTFLCLVEREWIGRDFGVNICTLPQLIALFIYAVNNPIRHEGIIQRLGKECPMLVYILHPFVWHSMERVYEWMGINQNMIANYLMPIIVVILTICMSIVYNWSKKLKLTSLF